jgi:hypothetical protein
MVLVTFVIMCAQLLMSVCHFWFFVELQGVLFRYDSEEKGVFSFVFLYTLAVYSTKLYSLCMT